MIIEINRIGQILAHADCPLQSAPRADRAKMPANRQTILTLEGGILNKRRPLGGIFEKIKAIQKYSSDKSAKLFCVSF
ncbi:hypothetical protein M2322_000300 [Rhodoblastus acidophilus]|uniref:hypothetical protein n=1 Tax=Rhodoblastus acidophilus TaxID=1074 RepID=UPI0022249426|nr:hypothetical protein [Rhodoblastus acidophilus]MCW2314780.1 hypothetical protein [Rhodoblastus acidophilus]